jgi:hypothetical protein
MVEVSGAMVDAAVAKFAELWPSVAEFAPQTTRDVMRAGLEAGVAAERRPPSPEEIEAGRTPRGGFTRARLAEWVSSGLLRVGWRRELDERYAAWARERAGAARREEARDDA